MIRPQKLRLYNLETIHEIPHIKKLSAQERFNLRVVAHVLPFRTNNYVLNELINWEDVPNDPMYQLTFAQKGMLSDEHFNRMARAVTSNSESEIRRTVQRIRRALNPHPAQQQTANVPYMHDEPVPGVQHKYRETALIFPSAGQTCHAYCTFCFRWAQFVGDQTLKFATDESFKFQEYLIRHPEITDILLTGGDPMIMSLNRLKLYLEPLLAPEFNHIQTIRIGTKSLSYWPYKYVTDRETDGLLVLFERIIKSGKHLALMAHFNHDIELRTEVVQEAIRRLRRTGIEIRSQSPIVRHINDDAATWVRMWKKQVNLGVIPYYMFVERNTGANRYFAMPLTRALRIYREAYMQVSGLARTARGPIMSATPGKIAIEGVADIHGEKVFVLNLLQGRVPDWCKRPFFAQYDPQAVWADDLLPAFGQEEFFYEPQLRRILAEKQRPAYKKAMVTVEGLN